MKVYVEGKLCLREFDEEFSYLALLENQYLYNRSERIEFIENLIVRQFEYYRLVDTY